MPTHRGKGKYLMKGVDMKIMMAGMFGRRNGSGKGGGPASHSGDNSIGLLAGTGLIGSGIPISTGAALAMKLQKKDSVALHFFGDGASNRGDFHESLNMAGVMKLPIVYVCDNNCYAMTVPADLRHGHRGYRHPGGRLWISRGGRGRQRCPGRIRSHPGGHCPGPEREKGPTLIECKTYRWLGHNIKDPGMYRKAEEVEAWKQKCPVKRFEAYLRDKGLLDDAKIKEVYRSVNEEIEEAVRFAESSPLPLPEDTLLGVYAD